MSMLTKVARSTPWTALSTLVGMVCQLAQVALLARILSQHEYGIAAAVVIVNAFFQIFLGAGLAPAIVQRQNVQLAELRSLHWLNLMFAAVLAILGMALSPWIAAALGVDSAAPVIAVASLTFIVAAFGQVPQAIMEKSLNFQALSTAEAAAAVTMLTVSVVSALAGAGAFAIPFGLLAGEGMRASLYLWGVRKDYRPGFHFRLQETRRFINFGLITTVDLVLNFFSANINAMATGRFLGASAMGGFNLSVTLGYSTPGRLNPIVTRVLFPVLAAIQHDLARVKGAYLRTVEMLAFINTIVLGAIAVTASALVPLAFGERWTWTVPLVSVVCIAGVLRSIGYPIGPLLSALDEIRLGFMVNIVKTAITLPVVIWLTATWGGIGAAWGMVCAQVLSMIISAWLLKRIVNITGLEYATAALRAVSSSVLPIAGAWVTCQSMDRLNFAYTIQLLASGVVWLVLVGIVVRLGLGGAPRELRALLSRTPLRRVFAGKRMAVHQQNPELQNAQDAGRPGEPPRQVGVAKSPDGKPYEPRHMRRPRP